MLHLLGRGKQPEWNQNRIEILSDRNLNSDAHEYLIDYLRTKVSDDCDAYIIGRK